MDPARPGSVGARGVSQNLRKRTKNSSVFLNAQEVTPLVDEGVEKIKARKAHAGVDVGGLSVNKDAISGDSGGEAVVQEGEGVEINLDVVFKPQRQTFLGHAQGPRRPCGEAISLFLERVGIHDPHPMFVVIKISMNVLGYSAWRYKEK